MTEERPENADDAPDATDEDAPFTCAYCGRDFAYRQWLALHRGIEHDDRLDEEERTAYEDALDEEREDLRLFRLKALAVLVLVYFGFIMAYAVFA